MELIEPTLNDYSIEILQSKQLQYCELRPNRDLFQTPAEQVTNKVLQTYFQVLSDSPTEKEKALHIVDT